MTTMKNQIQLEKKNFRTKIKNQLQICSTKELQEKSEKICENILSWNYFEQAKNIFFFMPLKTEANIQKVIEKSLLQNKNCYIPKVKIDGTMDFFKLDNKNDLKSQIEIGSYNILEPKENLSKFDSKLFSFKEFSIEKNIIFIPATAFDKNKNRIGKGKGFYDKLLSQIPPNCKINTFFTGISFEFLIYDEIPIETTDIKMDFIITDEKIF